MVHLNVGEPVSGGAYALPHGHTQGSHVIRTELLHLMKIIFHCQETHLNINSGGRGLRQASVTISVGKFPVQESKSDRCEISTLSPPWPAPTPRGDCYHCLNNQQGALHHCGSLAALWLVNGAHQGPLIGQSHPHCWQPPTGPGIYWSMAQHLIFS